MDVVIGLLVLTGQVRGIVILFGGHKNAPNGLRIAIGIAMIFMLLAVIGLAS